MKNLIAANGFFTFIAAILVAGTAFATENGKTVVLLVNGMTITTGNSYATVEVRAKSFGPGFCAVDVHANGDTAGVLAPPFVWSTWQNLSNHIGTVSYTLSYDKKCDTDALVEVRYKS